MGNGKLKYGPVLPGGGHGGGKEGNGNPIFPVRVNRIILDVDSGINKVGDFDNEEEKRLQGLIEKEYSGG